MIDHENQQISVPNRFRKRNGNELTRLSQRKHCGNTKQRVHFRLTRFPRNRPAETQRNFEPSGFRNISELRKHLISPCLTTEFRFTHGANHGLGNVFI